MKLRPVEDERDERDERDELFEICQKWFGFTILDAEPIVRGWLNRKWKLDTTHGVFLLKSYHPDRYRLYDGSALVRALRWQSELHTQGLPCPQILMHQGAQLHSTPSGQRFLSGNLDGETFNLDATQGFLDGYRTQREFPTGRILRTLRMLHGCFQRTINVANLSLWRIK